MSEKVTQVPGPRLVMFGTAFNAALHEPKDGDRLASLFFESGDLSVEVRLPADYLEQLAKAVFTLSGQAQQEDSGLVLPNGNKVEDIAAAAKRLRGEDA